MFILVGEGKPSRFFTMMIWTRWIKRVCWRIFKCLLCACWLLSGPFITSVLTVHSSPNVLIKVKLLGYRTELADFNENRCSIFLSWAIVIM